MTGKLADTVMSVRNGEQIARKYQPVVFNPSTPAQVAQRAKLKLMSQLSAVMAPAIAIPRKGSVSSRNLFTKKNFGLVTYNNNEAAITLENVQLTNSVVGMNGIIADRENDDITLSVRSGGEIDVNRVVYVAFAKKADGKLSYFTSVVATSLGAGYDWNATIPLSNEELVIYAYGVRDNTENARTIFGDLEAPTAMTVAKLVVNRTLTETDITLTETVSYSLSAVTSNAKEEIKPSKKK